MAKAMDNMCLNRYIASVVRARFSVHWDNGLDVDSSGDIWL